MIPLSQLPRLWDIFAALLRYRLNELVALPVTLRILAKIGCLFVRPIITPHDSLGKRLRLALTELGPIFIKFGQILSTRRDLLPVETADELTLLQDQVEPFCGEEAKKIVENALKGSIASLYKNFDLQPLASASIAQVHAAQLPDGRKVVVKVLRPGIEMRINADMKLLRTLGNLLQRYHPAADKITHSEVVDELETH